jgi:hypothetical protein
VLKDNGIFCIISFKSVHKRERYTTAPGRCNVKGCSASYFLKINKNESGDYRVEKFLEFELKQTGIIQHTKDQKTKNPLAGVNRTDKQKEMQVEGVYSTFYKDKCTIIDSVDEYDQLVLPPSIKAYTKALHEANSKARKHFDTFCVT